MASRDMSIMPVSEEQLRAQAKQRQEVQEKQRARRYDRVQPLPERGQDEEEEELDIPTACQAAADKRS